MMMRRKIAAMLAIMLLVTATVSSQYQQNLPQPKPIPPNAAAMFKVLERPLGTFTGTIPISFPLCSVSSGSLSADLSLNYTTTGGIKVEELSSSVGLGFSLSDGGGRITQSVRGWPDDWSSGMLNNAYLKPSQFNSSNSSHLYYANHDQLDLEPDVFMYSFSGKTGKFFFKENGELVKMTNDGITIDIVKETNAGAPGGIGFRAFIITDESGSKYYFGRKKDGSGNYRIQNMSSYSSGSSPSPGRVSSISFFLTEVWDMNSENSIKYTYTPGGTSFIGFAGSGMPLTLGGLDCYPGFNTFQNYGTVETDGAEYMVSRIDASSGYVIFNTASDFTYGPKKVTSIELYDSTSNFRKKYKFNYGTNFSSYRWKLTSFSEFGSAGPDSLTHKFEYDMFNNLPDILTGCMDMWGFYNNGANNNTALIPNIIVSNGYGNFYWDYNANRVANGFYAQANILTKITYPTGGYRQMEYEGNKAAALGDFFMYHPDQNFMTPRTFTESNFHNYGTFMPCLQKLFTVNSSYGLVKFSYYLNSVNTALCGSNYNVKLYRLLDSTDLTGGALIYTFPNGQSSNSWNIPNGYYRVDVNLTTSSSCTIGSITGDWSEGIADTAPMISTPYGTWHRRQYNVGGVRVKALKDYDPVANKTYITRYNYKMYSVDSTMGSGLLASPVDITSVENNWYTRCQYVKVGGNTAYPLASDGGSFVVYPEVRTVDSANGWTDQIYTYAYDQPGYGFPATPLYDYSYYRGKLAQEKVYRQDNKLLKKTMNEWMWSIPKSQISKRVKMYWHRDPLGTPYSPDYWSEGAPPMGGCNDEFSDCIADITDVSDYYFNLPVTVPYQTIDSVFAPDIVAPAQVVKTNYSYDTSSSGVYFLKQKKVTINNNQTKEQSYKYAFTPVGQFNLGLNSAEQIVKDTLKNRNYLQPIEVTDSVKTGGTSPVFLSGAKYNFTNTSGKIRLSKFTSYTNTLSDYSELNFSGYDSRGNLTEQYKTNDVKEVYLWGYLGTVPVAKVVGSTYSTVAGLVNLSVLNSPSSEAVMRTELDKIHTGLAGSAAQVTTYTYDTRYGMTSMKDASGKLLTYNYDMFGRLTIIKDQAGNVVKKYCYNYQGQPGNCSVMWYNVAKSGNFTRNNCGSGYTAGTVTYTVPTGTYSSTTSQQDADDQATNAVNANGQSYANTNGTCTAIIMQVIATSGAQTNITQVYYNGSAQLSSTVSSGNSYSRQVSSGTNVTLQINMTKFTFGTKIIKVITDTQTLQQNLSAAFGDKTATFTGVNIGSGGITVTTL